VRDCESRNGTVLNARTLREPKRLRAGDRLYAGNLTIEVREPVQKQVITFVPEERDQSTIEATVVTSLDNVLRKTSVSGQPAKDNTLNSARVVQALIRAGQELASHQPRQRATVRRSTPIVVASLPSRRSVTPSRIAAIKVTITAR